MASFTDKPLVVLAAALLMLTQPVCAQLYKGVDAEGNIVYSDKPFDNAEQFNPPTLSVMDAPKKPEAKEEATEEDEAEKPATSYTRFDIASPIDGETIWNNPNLSITMNLTPALATAEGHSIWLLMDGRPVVQNSGSPVVNIGQAYRGTHTFEGQVRNQNNEIIKRTPPIKLYIKQSSVQ